MATRHVCDVCGREVASRSDLWRVEFSPVERVRGVPDGRRHEGFECCGKCKRRAYVALMEGEGGRR